MWRRSLRRRWQNCGHDNMAGCADRHASWPARGAGGIIPWQADGFMGMAPRLPAEPAAPWYARGWTPATSHMTSSGGPALFAATAWTLALSRSSTATGSRMCARGSPRLWLPEDPCGLAPLRKGIAATLVPDRSDKMCICLGCSCCHLGFGHAVSRCSCSHGLLMAAA